MINSKLKSILLTSGRTGSSLIIRSLIDNGYNVASEPLNFNFQDYPKYVLYKMDYIKNIGNRDKIEIIHKILKDYDLCKILYYQLDMESTKQLCKEYNIVLLLRNPFDSFISFKIAEVLNRWHNQGQDRIIPENKINIPIQEMINHISQTIEYNLNYIPLASRIVTYNDINNMWHPNMKYFFTILGKQFKTLKKPFLKNPEKPQDFIENYQELRSVYDKFYRRLV
jgi:hypothetical protein